MPVQRLLPVILSVLFAIVIWTYGVLSLQTDVETRGGYATLVCGEDYSDHEIRSRLDSRGLTGLVSESDQWFLLDCFGGIEKIPLVEYSQRLFPFDPRNDGYAEKLRSLFVRDGKRFVYIPIGINRPENLETEIAQALTGISYSFDYSQPPPKRDIFLPLVAFSLTACAFFIIPALRRRLNAGLLPCLIALSPLAFGLAPGFALVSLLAGFAALLAEPGHKAPFSTGRQSAYVLPRPFTARWLLAVAMIACYGFFSFFSGLPVLFTFFVLAAFCCALAVSIRLGGGAIYGGKTQIKPTAKKMYPHSRRFTPVEIISRRNTEKISFFPVMLPFAAMALALAFAGYAMPQPPSLLSNVVNISPPPFMAPPSMAPPSMAPPSMALPEDVITEADFQEHYLFQSAFSLRALGKDYEDNRAPPVIAAYELSSNGLLNPSVLDIDEELQIPDFPLGDLLRGLSSPLPRVVDEGNRGNSPTINLLFALLPILFILPALIYGRRKKGSGDWGLGSGGRRRSPHAEAQRTQRRKVTRERQSQFR
jgi:hypothetical protein